MDDAAAGIGFLMFPMMYDQMRQKREDHIIAICPHCGTVNDHPYKFCKECGKGQHISNRFRTCPYCGEALDLPKQPRYCPFCSESLCPE